MRVNNPKHGGIIILVTLALFAMAGVLGLAVDLGASYFIEKDTQAAADAAAMATAIEAYTIGGASGPYDCETQGGPNSTTIKCETTRIACAASPTSPPGSTTDAGCLYAQENGFNQGGDGGRQIVSITSNAGTSGAAIDAPVFGTVPVYYWATAQVAQSKPQLFSAMLGNTSSLISSKATAAVVDSVVIGSLLLLNRRNDCVPLAPGSLSRSCGLDLDVQANDNGTNPVTGEPIYALDVAGGIIMSSTRDGSGGAQAPFATENTGGGTVKSDFAMIRGGGRLLQIERFRLYPPPDKRPFGTDFS